MEERGVMDSKEIQREKKIIKMKRNFKGKEI
jgi:hypothetical protein